MFYRIYDSTVRCLGRVEFPDSPPHLLRMHNNGMSVFYMLQLHWEGGSTKINPQGAAYVEWEGLIYGLDSQNIIPEPE